MTNFLDKSKQVVIPTGGDFTPSGLIGPWQAGVVYKVMTKEDMPANLKPDSVREKSGGWKDYYYFDYEKAADALEEIGSQYNPQGVWHFEVETINVMNFSNEDIREKFGASIGFDVAVTTLRSAKYRHEFHMIALPMAVVAMANLLGYDNPGFDISELWSQDTVFNDATQALLVGHPGEEDENSNVVVEAVPYTESVLWERRAELWEALGEPNPQNYQLMDADKLATVSKKLSECLEIVHYPWSSPAFVRLVSVNDPRVDATYGENKRLNIPAIFEIFPDEATARTAADVDIARFADTTSSGGDSKTSSADVAPTLPASWASAGMSVTDWKNNLRDAKGDKKLTPITVKQVAETVDATPDDVRAWWEYV